tara:strand:- start:1155 stop:1280 length:126 start_codon:yes stop_codon:yes gene_type:complete
MGVEKLENKGVVKKKVKKKAVKKKWKYQEIKGQTPRFGRRY